MEILRSNSVDLADEDEDEEDQYDEQKVGPKERVAKKKKFVGASNVRGPMDVILTYAVNLPFNVVRDEGFPIMLNAIGEYGRGLPPPSYHNMRVTLLNRRVEKTKKFVDSFRPHWEEYRCSILSDFWTDGKGRCLINFLVNCPLGTIFLKSLDASEHVKNAQLIVEMINEVIEDVGEANIVQFIIDNGSNFKAAKKILEQHPKMFWTPCAVHCVNLMIQDISEQIPKTKSTLADARAIVFYIYNHGRILNMMRKLTKNKELHRSCVTRLFDTEEKPNMGYINDAVDRAKGQIKKNVADVMLVTKLLGMIQSRWSDQLHHPLHAAGCYLNPAIFHGEKARDIKKNIDILTGLYVVINRSLVPDEDENDKVRQDLNLYIDSIGQFESSAAIRGKTKVAPYIWWRTYGIDTPLPQTFSMSVLSQTCSASPCERNWSTFDNGPDVTLQEFVDGTNGLLWSVAREAMGGNEEFGARTRSKRSRYRDDGDATVEVDDLEQQLEYLVDVDSEDDFMAFD
ncbi:uncharacterized protein LOC143629943 [Bidens hawaiensis]|uniref:uncharacterized protein LOC143629943 n=1 Tax=Bidens hawaiensis TaxID=980011 RepID=UPI004049AF22